MDEKLTLDVKDLQRCLGIGRDTAYSLMRNRAFPSVRIGNRYLVEKTALTRWLKCYEGKEFML
ncbi:MAG: helix-turn-helix domain-containing protein [Blautia sp.]|nr:helix-turn-helix domain-containing protein [Blautia sp.]